jgi:hypothetical protein
LLFERPASLRTVSFTFGIFEGAYIRGRPDATDGIELQVIFTRKGQPPQRLLTRKLDPCSFAGDRGIQTTTVALPPDQAGQLLIALTAGPDGDPTYDWSFIGSLRGSRHAE